MYDENNDIIDFVELIDFTLSSRFIETWKFKYSEKFLKTFQFKVLESLKTQKPIKIKTLILILKKNNKYSDDQIKNFFDSIDIDIYRPLITGSI